MVEHRGLDHRHPETNVFVVVGSCHAIATLACVPNSSTILVDPSFRAVCRGLALVVYRRDASVPLDRLDLFSTPSGGHLRSYSGHGHVRCRLSVYVTVVKLCVRLAPCAFESDWFVVVRSLNPVSVPDFLAMTEVVS